MLPEEKELARLEAEQAELEEQVASAELGLETLKTETARFQYRYYGAVGRLYAQLDDIEAKIAGARSGLNPDNSILSSDATAAERRARESAVEAGSISAKPVPATVISPALKQAYRQAVKLLHPDLALSDRERQRRTKLMAKINLAYERGDQDGIKKAVDEFGTDPEAIIGQDIGARMIRAIRRIAQLKRRLNELNQEIEAQRKAEIFRLREIIEKAEAGGDDPLGDLQGKLQRRIAESKIRFDGMQPGKDTA